MFLLLLLLAFAKQQQDRFGYQNRSIYTDGRYHSTPDTYLICLNRLGWSWERSVVDLLCYFLLDPSSLCLLGLRFLPCHWSFWLFLSCQDYSIYPSAPIQALGRLNWRVNDEKMLLLVPSNYLNSKNKSTTNP